MDASERDWAILADVARLRYVTGHHLQRLHFVHHSPAGQAVMRGRVLRRLVRDKLLHAYPRRIGGMRGGSGGIIYTLATGGQRALHQRASTTGPIRKPWPHLPYAIDHALQVSELYVSLVEGNRRGAMKVARFVIEPGCWWPDRYSGRLKPDAHLVLHSTTMAYHWWIEIDRDTERVPVVAKKLARYVAFARSGQKGPDGAVPRVAVIVPSTTRRDDIAKVAPTLPGSEVSLILVAVAGDAPRLLAPVPEEESSRW